MLPGILPDLSASEALDATRIYGASGEPPWPRSLLRRAVQETRYAGRGSRTNGTVRFGTAELLRELTPEAAAFLTRAAERLSLSGRAIGKACRVARTIADLAGDRRAGLPHAAEALQYRLAGFGAPGEAT